MGWQIFPKHLKMLISCDSQPLTWLLMILTYWYSCLCIVLSHTLKLHHMTSKTVSWSYCSLPLGFLDTHSGHSQSPCYEDAQAVSYGSPVGEQQTCQPYLSDMRVIYLESEFSFPSQENSWEIPTQNCLNEPLPNSWPTRIMIINMLLLWF